MRFGFSFPLAMVLLCGQLASAQTIRDHIRVSDSCAEWYGSASAQSLDGSDDELERLLAVIFDPAQPDHLCAGLILHSFANRLAGMGRIDASERFAERSVSALEMSYPEDDAILFWPLQVLAASQFEQGKIARAAETVRRMQAVRLLRPNQRAAMHGIAGTLLQAQHHPNLAEREFLSALDSWTESGRAETSDAGAVFNALAVLYLEQQRFDEAEAILDRAFKIFAGSSEAVPMDFVKLFNNRGVMYARAQKWHEAAGEFSRAVSVADSTHGTSPVVVSSVLANFASVLRKDHRGREARAIESRLAGLRAALGPQLVVDVSALLSATKDRP